MSVNKVNKKTGDLSLLAGGTFYADNPIGSIIPYGGSTAPAGWFICDGTELVRTTYPELFAVIGTSFGTPSDNTKFKLPDLREATTKGVGLTGKSNNHIDADGLALGEFIDDRIQEHTHYAKFTDEEGFLAAKGSAYGVVVRDPQGQLTGTNASGRFGATTEVKAVGVNYIIKAVSVGVPADFMSAVDEAVDSKIEEMQQYDDNSYVKITGLTPASQVSSVSLYAKRKGNVVTLRGNFVIFITGSTHNTLALLPANSIPAKYRPTVSTVVTSLGYRNSETTFMIGRFILDTDGSSSLGEYYTVGNDQAETVFSFTITYIV